MPVRGDFSWVSTFPARETAASKMLPLLGRSLRRRLAASSGLLRGSSAALGGSASALLRSSCSSAWRRWQSSTSSPAAAAAAAGTGRRSASSAAERKAAAAADRTVMLVESPAKAKKIQLFLGPQFKVLASYGHVRDLPAKPGSVDPEAGFEMRWEVPLRAEERLGAIAAALKGGAGRLVLATDPDREGEAISWHLLQELRARKALGGVGRVERVTFTEVTQRAVTEALAAPRELSAALVNAYLARRALDYLFGFELSPLLWRKVPGARSAGRVQSAALRLLCERETAIAAFEPQRYHTVEAEVRLPGGGAAPARLVSVDGKPVPRPGYGTAAEAEAVLSRVRSADFWVWSVARRESSRAPPPPFTTSTLQQEANKHLGMAASAAMSAAQALYEAGHITYHRTDGASIAPEAEDALRAAAAAAYGAEYVPPEPRRYTVRSKVAQEAHEAVRPTDPARTAADLAAVGEALDPAAARLYALIRSRALACQMASAQVAHVAADFSDADTAAPRAAGPLRLRASASHVVFPGFLAAYADRSWLTAAGSRQDDSSSDGEGEEPEEEGEQLPEGGEACGLGEWSEGRSAKEASRQRAAAALAALSAGDSVELLSAAASAHETRPPPRLTEGTLVKALEELGIGRPSTYAPTMRLLQERKYVTRAGGRALCPEPLGRVLSAFLRAYFPACVDYDFTRAMEAQLDQVADGGVEWKGILEDFWGPFAERVAGMAGVSGAEVNDMLNATIGRQYFVQRPGGADPRTCPDCGSALSLKLSRTGGPFIGCSAFPECAHSRSLGSEADTADLLPHEQSRVKREEEAAKALGIKGWARHLGTDPATGRQMFIRLGLFGPYVQLGLDEEEGMRRAPLSKSATVRSITLDDGLSLLALPKTLGHDPVTGEVVVVNSGKFGPFVRCGAVSRSIPKEYNALELTLDMALLLIKRKNESTAARQARSRPLAVKEGSDGGGAAAAEGGEGGGEEAGFSGRTTPLIRPRSAYKIFMDELRAEAGRAKLARNWQTHVSDSWQEMSAEGRRVYDDAAERDRVRYRLELGGQLEEAEAATWQHLGLEAQEALLVKAQGRKLTVGPVARRPPSAYNLFFREASAAAKARPPEGGAGAGDICTYLAERWRTLDLDTKAGYRRRSEALRKQYQQTKVWREESQEGRDAAMAPPPPKNSVGRPRLAAAAPEKTGQEGVKEPRPRGRPRKAAAEGGEERQRPGAGDGGERRGRGRPRKAAAPGDGTEAPAARLEEEDGERRRPGRPQKAVSAEPAAAAAAAATGPKRSVGRPRRQAAEGPVT